MTIQEFERKDKVFLKETKSALEGIYEIPKPTEEQLKQMPTADHVMYAKEATLYSEHLFPLAYTTNAVIIAHKVGIFDILDKPMTIDEIAEYLVENDKIELDPLNMEQEIEVCKQKIRGLFDLFSAPQLKMVQQVNGGQWELTKLGSYLRSDAKVGIAVAMLNLTEYYAKPSFSDYPRHVFGTKAYDDIGSPDEGAVYTERVPQKVRAGLLTSLPKFGVNLDEGDPLVLDLGCGVGDWLIEIANKHTRAKGIGLDYNLGSCEMGQEKAEASGLGSRLEYRCVDLATDRIPLSDASVDLITAINFHHFFPRYGDQNVTDEIYRVLKPGGKYISIVPLCDGADDTLMLSTQTMFQFLFSGFTGWRTEEYLHNIAQKAGFKVTKIIPMIFRKRQAVFFAVKT
ncbi:MAG: methyltransferase domain-containing protein [Promethearchaeota archaeon]